MNLTEEDVVKILKIIEESDFDSLQLEWGELKLTVGKNGCAPPLGVQSVLLPGTAALKPTEIKNEAAPKAGAQVREKTSASDQQLPAIGTAVEENLIPIKSPMVGTFFCAPEPGSEPFAKVGSKVDKDTVVGLIEVMKVFTSVGAGVRGESVKCLVEDAEFVEYGQSLFLVRPDAQEEGQ